jgi:hypothetical protein
MILNQKNWHFKPKKKQQKKQNAASILGTIPQSPDLEEMFYILK